MFLFDNTIIAENLLTVAAEQTKNFFISSMNHNKKLLTSSVEASNKLITDMTTYGTDKKIVTEALSVYHTAITSGVHAFNSSTALESKMWLDNINTTHKAKNAYIDTAMEALLSNADKVEALKEFKYVLPVAEDMGYGVLNELNIHAWINTARKCVDKAMENADCSPMEIREALNDATGSILNNGDIYEISIEGLKPLFEGKIQGVTGIQTYKEKALGLNGYIEKVIESIDDTDPVSCQKKCSNLIAIATCVNEHLAMMIDNYRVVTEKVDTLIGEYIPEAERYLLQNK